VLLPPAPDYSGALVPDVALLRAEIAESKPETLAPAPGHHLHLHLPGLTMKEIGTVMAPARTRLGVRNTGRNIQQ